MTITKYAGALALGSAIALAACGGETSADADGDGAISMDEMRAEVASAGADLRPEPGKYSATMTLVKAEIPGMPPEARDMMGAMMNRTFEYCLTPEQANDGFERSLTEGQDDSCTIDKFELDGGEIDMAMTCTPDDGGQMNVAMTGTVTADRNEINVKTQGTIPQMGEADMEFSMLQERVGDCD